MRVLSVFISIISIFLGIAITLFYYNSGGKEGLIGAGWIFAIIGAPTSLLSYIPYKLGIINSFIANFIWIWCLYLLQYQLIAFTLYFYYRKNKNVFSNKTILFFCILISTLIISVVLVWNIIMGNL